MDRYDVESCIEILLNYVKTRDEAADILDALEPIMFQDDGCSCCSGNEDIYWKDNYNNVFVGRTGDMTVMVKDRMMRFKVNYCPKCGKKF